MESAFRSRLERRDALAYSLLPDIGSVAFRQAIETTGSAAEALRAWRKAEQRDAAREAADAVLRRVELAGARMVLFGDAEYPRRLIDLRDAPAALFLLGRLPDDSRPSIGIVGTRRSSQDGERIAHRMAVTLSGAGAVIVSGMALGIDAAAHRGALDAGGRTIAVLGGGADLPYPPSHRLLHEAIRDRGLVMSEAHPGTHPVKGAFPKRNRIIAGLSDRLIVVEAGARSGALITAAMATELGRDVAAVPGPIDSPRHAGSNALLADGATFLGNVDHALTFAGLSATGAAPTRGQGIVRGGSDAPDHAQNAILEAVGTGCADLDDLARSTGLPARDLARAVAALELSGRLSVSSSGAVSLQA